MLAACPYSPQPANMTQCEPNADMSALLNACVPLLPKCLRIRRPCVYTLPCSGALHQEPAHHGPSQAIVFVIVIGKSALAAIMLNGVTLSAALLCALMPSLWHCMRLSTAASLQL